MSEFDGMLDEFADWAKTTGDFKVEEQTIVDGVPQPKTLVTKYANKTVNFWTETSEETDQGDKYLDKARGIVLVPASWTVTIGYQFVTSDATYKITGVDNYGGLSEVKELTWVSV